jgi:hypothetical protein
MHTIYIDGERARTPQEVADAVQSAPETVRIESGPDTGRHVYDCQLTELPRHSSVLFSTEDGSISEMYFNDEGRYLFGAIVKSRA